MATIYDQLKGAYPNVDARYFNNLANKMDRDNNHLFYDVKTNGQNLQIDAVREGKIIHSFSGKQAESFLLLATFEGIDSLGEAKSKDDSSYEYVAFDSQGSTVLISDFNKTSKYLKDNELGYASNMIEEKIQEKRNLQSRIDRKVCREARKEKVKHIIAGTLVVATLIGSIYGLAAKQARKVDPNWSLGKSIQSFFESDHNYWANPYDHLNPEESPEMFGGYEGVKRLEESQEKIEKIEEAQQNNPYGRH